MLFSLRNNFCTEIILKRIFVQSIAAQNLIWFEKYPDYGMYLICCRDANQIAFIHNFNLLMIVKIYNRINPKVDIVSQMIHQLSLLCSLQLTESQSVAVDFSTLCQSEDIPFFRFSPEFSNYVTSGERDDKKILDMMVGTRSYYEKRDVEAKLVRMSQVLRFLDHLKDKYEGRVPL